MSIKSKIAKWIVGKIGKDILKPAQMWRYEPDAQRKGSISDERRKAELKEFEKRAKRSLNTLRGKGLANHEYYTDIDEWINLEPKSAKQEREKLYVLADYLSDKSVSTTSGRRKVVTQETIDKFNEDSKHGSQMAMKYLKWRWGKGDMEGLQKSQRNISQLVANDLGIDVDKVTKKQIVDELTSWHLLGEPD